MTIKKCLFLASMFASTGAMTGCESHQSVQVMKDSPGASQNNGHSGNNSQVMKNSPGASQTNGDGSGNNTQVMQRSDNKSKGSSQIVVNGDSIVVINGKVYTPVKAPAPHVP